MPCQKRVNSGRNSRPRVTSQTHAPKNRAIVQLRRLSPPQILKTMYTQPHIAATAKMLSAKVVSRGRRGRRKP